MTPWGLEPEQGLYRAARASMEGALCCPRAGFTVLFRGDSHFIVGGHFTYPGLSVSPTAESTNHFDEG